MNINNKMNEKDKKVWSTTRLSAYGLEIPENPPLLDMNQLMLQLPCKKENKFIFFCPCYLRIWIDNFTEVKIEDLTAKVKIMVKFDLDVTGLPESIDEEVK